MRRIKEIDFKNRNETTLTKKQIILNKEIEI